MPAAAAAQDRTSHADIITRLSNTFVVDAEPHDAWIFDADLQTPPTQTILFVDECDVTMITSLPRRIAGSNAAPVVIEEHDRIRFNLRRTILIPNAAGEIATNTPAGPDTRERGSIQFISIDPVNLEFLEDLPVEASPVELLEAGVIGRFDGVTDITYVNDAAPSALPVLALANAILSYQRTYCLPDQAI